MIFLKEVTDFKSFTNSICCKKSSPIKSPVINPPPPPPSIFSLLQTAMMSPLSDQFVDQFVVIHSHETPPPPPPSPTPPHGHGPGPWSRTSGTFA